MDVMLCTYLDYHAPADLDLVAADGFQSEYGHHALLFGVRSRQSPGTHKCTDADMVNVRYLAGHGGEGATSLPVSDDVAFGLREDEQLMIQTHWINHTDQVIDGQGAFHLTVEPASPSARVADLFTWLTTNSAVSPGADGSAESSCTVGEELNIFLMGGHAHEWGTYITLTHARGDGAPEVIYETEWNGQYQFNPPRNEYSSAAPFVVRPGDKMSVSCQDYNDTGSMLTFPGEMCVGWAYYFPAVREINCVNGFWPGQ